MSYELFREDLVIGGMIPKGNLKGIQDLILEVINDHFSPQVVDHVGRVIAAVEDVQLLRKFYRLLVRLSKDEQEAFAALDDCFAITENVQLVRTFLKNLVQLSSEQEVFALWVKCFPIS